MKYRVRTNGMGCKHCIARVTKAMEALGANIVTMELNDFVIEYGGDTAGVKAAIEALGFGVVSIEEA
ncbi:MAG: hypothetical protein J5586_02865 [Clostridia bacterium]|nr:hypothetical protein [Clostridia bacterium]